MKKSIFARFCSVLAVSAVPFLLVLNSCFQVGLGEAIDMEAPVLTVSSLKCGDEEPITSFEGGVYCKKDVAFYGVATDNNRVERVYAQVKWSDEGDFVTVASTGPSGNDWSLALSLEQEGACYVKIVAEDPSRNISPKSTKTITLFVDETAPVASAWYIDRGINGIQYGLKSKETLEGLDLSLPENKDAAQNVSFTVCANANDLFGVKVVSLIIKDEDGAEILKIKNDTETASNYAPKFAVTHDALVAGKAELSSGKHYLQVWYEAEDIIEHPDSNKTADGGVEVNLGYFIWWPESDLPRITNSSIEEAADGTLSLSAHINDVLNLSFFDDDCLDEGYFVLLSESETQDLALDWDSLATNSDAAALLDAVTGGDTEKEKRTKKFSAENGERETVVTLTAPTEPQIMRLLAIAWDKTDGHVMVRKDISVRVTDEATPILIITSPKSNTIPALSMQDNDSKAIVTVTGQTLDSSGCKYLEFVWVPDSLADKKTLAQNWLESLGTAEKHDEYAPSGSAASKCSPVDSGMKLWSVALKDEPDENGFKKSDFEFTFDLLADFTYNGANEREKDKYFLAKLTRKDGNYLYQEYKLAADNLPPTIVPVTPSTDMQAFANDADCILKYYAKKDSGLPVDSSKYRIVRVDVSPTVVISDSVEGYSSVGLDSSGRYCATISKDYLTKLNDAGQKPKYRFYATDIFGNETYSQYTIVISDLPTLKSISTTDSGNKKKGDKVDIVATFSKPVGVSGEPRIRLTGLNNRSDAYAVYKGGSGTTAIHFEYTVEAGDKGTLELDPSVPFTGTVSSPIDDNGSETLVDKKIIIDTSWTNGFDSKGIKVDGIVPLATAELAGDGAVNGGTMYLKEGKSLSATVTVDKAVTVQGNPSVSLNVGDGIVTLPFTGVSSSGSVTTISFGKTVSSGDSNGAVTWKTASYITNSDCIVDDFGNPVSLGTVTSDNDLYIDTAAPKTPSIKAEYNGSALTLAAGKYKDKVSFTLSKAEADSTIEHLQYSTDGGSNWEEAGENERVDLTSSASFTYRAVDYAGNVSEIPTPVYLDIESSFPAFSVECVNSAGNYKAGSTITLRVLFVREVNIASNASATVIVSAGTGSGGGAASLDSSFKGKSKVTSAEFTYTVKNTDDFTLKVAEGGVTLDGFTDEYGITQGSKKNAECARPEIKCDGKAPSVSSMTDGTGSSGNVIVLTFDEKVIKSSGSITLRRTNTNKSGVKDGAWAIPPVLTAAEFNKICSNISSDDKNILSLQENGHDMEDSEWVGSSSANYSNEYYHGTGQFAGPYKKMTQGILDSGKPDVSTKYVLDFDMDIWDTDSNTYYFGKTFTSSAQKAPSTPAECRTVKQLRDVLEKAGYHKRVLDVTSSAVVVSENTVTITFPKGLCDESAALPGGIEWELLVESGAFMDESGNTMEGYTSDSFFSSGVQTPVIRVDRYSYGLGIYQGNDSGGESVIENQGTVPSGYVRVRIDCQTPKATIKYAKIDADIDASLTTAPVTEGRSCTWKYKKTSDKTKDELKTTPISETYSKPFAAGNGSYGSACRQYIVAKASLGSSEENGYEGIFQTVVKFDFSNWPDKPENLSIRGTTGWSGEPSISPFPLRDAQVGSPFIRICYKKNDSAYYWVSYEVLEDASISGYVKGNWSNYYLSSWAYVYTGGYTEISGLVKD